ncbi:glyoxylase-like metal-dependent hydrolase (beta-lactamase superfamily II) [Neobacillus niacini]|uniref:MBL fold metallo-hydrolase n=1 Tax=Neobacillus niacini TaxID=86668 RepID=UPI0027866C97|nr:MBL fold metallo-hydrolase [Neobacillus niacini]MDQ1002185.1 glyoxylase-like metal-dependent hydrolase (beta-lactamase superfamily II) [Neobacillus niacini]
MEQKEVKFPKYSMKVDEGIYQITLPTPYPVGPVNLYLIEGEILTLLDVGPKTEEAWEGLVNGVEEIGYTLDDIKQILITHYHPDHTGILQRVKRETGARALGHPLLGRYLRFNEEFINFRAGFFHQLYKENGVPEEFFDLVELNEANRRRFSEPSEIDIVLKNTQTVPGLKDWQVIYTPGHSQDHLSIYRKNDGVFIGGDHIIENTSTSISIEPPWDETSKRPQPLIQYRAALEVCANLEITKIYSGHGNPIDNHKEIITKKLESHWQKAMEIFGLIEVDKKTAFDLTKLLYPKKYQKLLNLTLAQTIGHLDLLLLVQQVNVQKKDGVFYYSKQGPI